MAVLVHHLLVVSALVALPIKDVAEGKQWLSQLIHALGMYPLAPATGAYCHDVGNQGLTLLQPITTSHIALHIWDAHNPAQLELDVYSCKAFDLNTVFEHLQPMLPTQIRHKFLDRSIPYA